MLSLCTKNVCIQNAIDGYYCNSSSFGLNFDPLNCSIFLLCISKIKHDTICTYIYTPCSKNKYSIRYLSIQQQKCAFRRYLWKCILSHYHYHSFYHTCCNRVFQIWLKSLCLICQYTFIHLLEPTNYKIHQFSKHGIYNKKCPWYSKQNQQKQLKKPNCQLETYYHYIINKITVSLFM